MASRDALRSSFVLVFLALFAVSCSKHAVVDFAMGSAFRPGPSPRDDFGRYVLLAGDTHCHVMPPDSPHHVSRGLDETVTLARDEGLDFVVLTPHVWAGFLEDATLRDEAIAQHAALRQRVAAHAGSGVVLVTGFEYTTRHFGHIGAAFGDLETALRDVPVDVSMREPARFFERYVETGGVLIINHPYLTPTGTIANSAWDLSWRSWTTGERPTREAARLERLAHAVETYNLAVDHLRDGFVLATPGGSTRAGMFQVERQIKRQGRRIVPVGGSDSHSSHLRATTFVLAGERTERGVRDALVAGRACIRAPAACTFEARGADRKWQPVGGAVAARREVEVHATGDAIQILRDSRVVARPASREVVRIAVPANECTLLRARVDGGESAPIYVNCPFAG